MSDQHTPGPWSWGDNYRGLYGAGPDNDVLMYAYCENMWLAHGKHQAANARLIASAPDLLEACQKFMDGISILNDGPDDSDVAHAQELLVESFKLGRAAINKATGIPAHGATHEDVK